VVPEAFRAVCPKSSTSTLENVYVPFLKAAGSLTASFNAPPLLLSKYVCVSIVHPPKSPHLNDGPCSPEDHLVIEPADEPIEATPIAVSYTHL
ncbi:hypothetical protein, partial [Escherichia coli]|uniref:hypothetical protein n=1 Tax=Escherichia coli TaxID=562 RepID=UPI001BB1EF2E